MGKGSFSLISWSALLRTGALPSNPTDYADILLGVRIAESGSWNKKRGFHFPQTLQSHDIRHDVGARLLPRTEIPGPFIHLPFIAKLFELFSINKLKKGFAFAKLLHGCLLLLLGFCRFLSKTNKTPLNGACNYLIFQTIKPDGRGN